MKSTESKYEVLRSLPVSVALDLGKINSIVFWALEREGKKENRDEQMITYLVSIAKLLPVSNNVELYKYC